jgi:hypothetical protein
MLFNKLVRSAPDKSLLPKLVAFVEVGDADVEAGDIDVEFGDTYVEFGDTAFEVGDPDVGVLDPDVEVGDTAFEVLCMFFEAQAAPADAVNDITNRTTSKMPSVCFIL